MTPLLISCSGCSTRSNLPGWGFIASHYYRLLCTMLRIRVRVVGDTGARPRRAVRLQSRFLGRHPGDRHRSRRWPSLPRREVANWPLVGITARLQRTVFVDRTRRHRTGQAVGEMVARLPLAPRWCCSRKAPRATATACCRSAPRLIGAVEEAVADGGGAIDDPADVDRLYRAAGHCRWDASNRPLVAWYGDLDFMPHFKNLCARGAVDAVVSYGEPFAADTLRRPQGHGQAAGRRRCAALTAATLRGRAAGPARRGVLKAS